MKIITFKNYKIANRYMRRFWPSIQRIYTAGFDRSERAFPYDMYMDKRTFVQYFAIYDWDGSIRFCEIGL